MRSGESGSIGEQVTFSLDGHTIPFFAGSWADTPRPFSLVYNLQLFAIDRLVVATVACIYSEWKLSDFCGDGDRVVFTTVACN